MPFTPAPALPGSPASSRCPDRGAGRAAGFASRSLIQDMFFILTMLVLAQFWNLLAGYGGLVSIGQQAFVGIGAYAMFGAVILAGLDPIPAILLGGVVAVLLAIPTAFFAFRLQGCLFRHRHLGHRRGGASARLAMAGRGRRHGDLSAALGDP
jgi:hypothetical protein